ncbi:unnamed protein product [Jaminaea pallidilutea]
MATLPVVSTTSPPSLSLPSLLPPQKDNVDVNVDSYFSRPFVVHRGSDASLGTSTSEEDESDSGRSTPDCIGTPEAISSLPSPAAEPATIAPHLFQALQEDRPTVLVVGVGYVGKHLVERFSYACNVIGFDLSAPRCKALQERFDADDLANITMISDLESDPRAANFDLALISVPTILLADNKTVDTRHIQSAVSMVASRARPGSTVVIESSVTVGMTRALLGPTGADLRSKGVFVGFSPERVDPGRQLPLFEDIPKVVAGIDDASLQVITRYYSSSFTTVVPVKSLETAELCKLYENCQRLMLIAYVNEVADACEQHGVDIHDVCAASATKPFGFTPFTSSLGAGGHCIPVNPFYLLSNSEMPLLRAAAEANQTRPIQKARQIASVAKERAARSKGELPTVLIYGMGFKAGEASLAYSPTVTLARELQRQDCRVVYYDEYVQSEEWQQLPSDLFNLHTLEDCFETIVVAQRPTLEHRAILDSLKKATVYNFVR